MYTGCCKIPIDNKHTHPFTQKHSEFGPAEADRPRQRAKEGQRKLCFWEGWMDGKDKLQIKRLGSSLRAPGWCLVCSCALVVYTYPVEDITSSFSTWEPEFKSMNLKEDDEG